MCLTLQRSYVLNGETVYYLLCRNSYAPPVDASNTVEIVNRDYGSIGLGILYSAMEERSYGEIEQVSLFEVFSVI